MTPPLDAQPVGVEAAKRVTLELMSVLGEFRDSITLVGGSAPPLMVGEQAADRYSGTLDVDVVVDPIELPEETYRTIAQLLGARGYEQGPQPFQWSRVIDVAGQPVRVQVDLLAPRTARSGRAHRHEEIGGGMLALRLEGAELLRVCYENKELRGVLPDGRRNSVEALRARALAFARVQRLLTAYHSTSR